MTTPNANRARRTWWRQFGQLYAVALLCTVPVALLSGFAAGRFIPVVDDSGTSGDFFGDPLSTAPGEPTDALLVQAEDALIHSRVDEALEAADQALVTNPSSETAAAIKANALFERFWMTDSAADRDAGRAMLDYIPAPTTGQGYAARGNLAFIDGYVEEAVTFLQQAVEVEPGSAYAQHQLGYMLDAAGRTEEALVHFEQALSLAPTMAWVQNNLGGVLTRLGRCDDYIAGLQSDVVAGCHNQTGVERFNGGNVASARESFQAAVNLAPGSGPFRVNLAGALLTLGMREQAMAEAQEARQLGISEHWVFAELGIQ